MQQPDPPFNPPLLPPQPQMACNNQTHLHPHPHPLPADGKSAGTKRWEVCVWHQLKAAEAANDSGLPDILLKYITQHSSWRCVP